jgi:hypothetical protein
LMLISAPDKIRTSQHPERGIMMPTVNVPVQLNVKHLMRAVKRLSPDELHEFTQQFTAWRNQTRQPSENEDDLITYIEKNSRLPDAEQRCFDRLRHKQQTETLTRAEGEVLRTLWQKVEQMDVVRLEALIKLAQLRGTDVRTCMRDLGLDKQADVF